MEGAVDELIGDHEVAGLVLFAERADGGNGEDAGDAEHFEGVDIGAEVDLGWEQAVSAAVTGEEGDLTAFECAEDEGVAGIAPGGGDVFFVNAGETGHGIQPAAADDADFRLLQNDSLAGRWLAQTRVRQLWLIARNQYKWRRM